MNRDWGCRTDLFARFWLVAREKTSTPDARQRKGKQQRGEQQGVFFVEKPSRRERGAALENLQRSQGDFPTVTPVRALYKNLCTKKTVQKSFVISESNEQAVTPSEISINKGDQNNPINMPSVKGNFDKPSSYHSNNGIKHRNNKTY